MLYFHVMITQHKPVKLKEINKPKRNLSQKRKITQTVNAILVSNTLEDATKILKCKRATIYKRMNKFPEIKERLSLNVTVNPELAKIRLQEKTLIAVKTLSDLMQNSPKDDIKLRSSQDILNRAGVVNQKDTNIQVNILNQIKADQKEYKI